MIINMITTTNVPTAPPAQSTTAGPLRAVTFRGHPHDYPQADRLAWSYRPVTIDTRAGTLTVEGKCFALAVGPIVVERAQ